MNRTILHNLAPEDFIHPMDARSMNKLENTRGMEKVVKKFYDLGVEKIIKLQYRGSSLKVSTSYFKEFNSLVKEASQILNQPIVPELYVQRSEELKAITLGVEKPMIIMTTEIADKFTNEELLFMIGREIGHIKCNHILYQEIGFIFPELIDAFAFVTLGLSTVISAGLRYTLFNWAQMAEYTADRAGLLACQDSYVVKKALAKLAGLPEKHWGIYNMDEFESQARNFEGLDEKRFDKFIRFMYGNNLWAIARGHELIKWMESGEYNRLLARKDSI